MNKEQCKQQLWGEVYYHPKSWEAKCQAVIRGFRAWDESLDRIAKIIAEGLIPKLKGKE